MKARTLEALTLGFGTTVAMWAVGYLGRLPAVMLPSQIVLLLFLACGFVCGAVAGMRVADPVRTGALGGAINGLLNLLILGSVLSQADKAVSLPAAALWIPGSILGSALLVAAGAFIGNQFRDHRQPAVEVGPSRFVWVAAAATFLLLAVGGLVTSKQAGLAVVDWPNSYGYNMFLYPLSRMTGGIYYEHAHRLFGSLVGLTTMVMAVLLQRCDTRGWVRKAGWVAVAMVVAQGILGGLRVTGSFTLSSSQADMAPSLLLALVHGVFGQLFFASLVGLGVLTSRRWLQPAGCISGDLKPATALLLGRTLVGLMVVQLVLGALQRHMEVLLWVHITMAAVIAPLAVGYGLRTWMLNPSHPVRRKLGLWLMAVTATQMFLGISAFAGTILLKGEDTSSVFALMAATSHQWCGALLFGFAVATLLWNGRHDKTDSNSPESTSRA